MWVGAETLKNVADRQWAKHNAFEKEHGLRAWVDGVEGKDVTITFFSANFDRFRSLLEEDPWGKPIFVVMTDDQMHVKSAAERVGFKNHLPGEPGVAWGSSGNRWVFTVEKDAERFKKGQVVRVYKEGWPVIDRAEKK